MPADMLTLVLPEILIVPEAHTLSLLVPVLLTLNSLLCTENTLPEGVLCTDQGVVPASEIVPLAKVKSSSHDEVMPEETVTDCEAVQPLAGLVTVTIYVPVALTTGFCAVLVKLLGPVQL